MITGKAESNVSRIQKYEIFRGKRVLKDLFCSLWEVPQMERDKTKTVVFNLATAELVNAEHRKHNLRSIKIWLDVDRGFIAECSTPAMEQIEAIMNFKIASNKSELDLKIHALHIMNFFRDGIAQDIAEITWH